MEDHSALARIDERDIVVGEVPLLRHILEIQSYSRDTQVMQDSIISLAKQFGVDDSNIVQDKGNIYITKGETQWYPCLVAHTDTVHKIVPSENYAVGYEADIYFAYDPVTQLQRGVGGDDKCGIYIALAALKFYENIKVAFFRDEEVGCLGAKQCDPEFFKNVRYILEADRRNFGDFVDDIGGPLMSKSFRAAVAPIIAKYGYKFSYGMMTDVDELKDHVAVSMANMSCGYYNPHSDKEVVSVAEVEICRELCFDIISNIEEKRWDHAKRPKFGNSFIRVGGSSQGSYYDWESGWLDEEEEDWRSYRWKSEYGSKTERDWQDKVLNGSVVIHEESLSNLHSPRTNSDKTYYSPDDKATVYFGKKGLYECKGIFTISMVIDPTVVRMSLDLPDSIKFYLEDNIVDCQIVVDMGASEFDNYQQAKEFAEAKMLEISLENSSLDPDHSEVTMLAGIEIVGDIPF